MVLEPVYCCNLSWPGVKLKEF